MKARNRLMHPLDKPCDRVTKWLTTREVAARIGISLNHAARLIDKGVIPGVRIPESRHRRVHPDMLEEFEKQHGYKKARGA
jgi:excisionase family DNA binding protein